MRLLLACVAFAAQMQMLSSYLPPRSRRPCRRVVSPLMFLEHRPKRLYLLPVDPSSLPATTLLSAQFNLSEEFQPGGFWTDLPNTKTNQSEQDVWQTNTTMGDNGTGVASPWMLQNAEGTKTPDTLDNVTFFGSPFTPFNSTPLVEDGVAETSAGQTIVYSPQTVELAQTVLYENSTFIRAIIQPKSLLLDAMRTNESLQLTPEGGDSTQGPMEE
ncbi:unnamed protein product [Protopolystoma xenopodis]|uniref:Uncharacterized protein n=1 Tax=Protopolystoma xenopodis TaxID=117903 RepID=A0A3S5B6Y3_9PLAT|nr:unnamed protein product [Protopolystoma xenopodis]